MTRTGWCSRQAGGDASAPQLAIVGLLLGGALGLFGLLHHLLQPTVVANPGLAAFSPPPGTRLVPLPRQSDAPALAELPPEAVSPLTAFAQAAAAEAKPDTKRPALKQPRASGAEKRSGDQRSYKPRQAQLDSGSSGGNPVSRREWSFHSRVWRGGPRSTF